MVLNVTAIIADLQNDNRRISGHQFQVRKHHSLRFSALDWKIGAVSCLEVGLLPFECHSGALVKCGFRLGVWWLGLLWLWVLSWGLGIGLSFTGT